jgi:hypothetical protein
MPLDAAHGQPPRERTAPPDLDRVAEPLRVGRLADQAGIRGLAPLGQPSEHLARAIDRRALLVAGNQEADRAGRALRIEEPGRGGHEAGDRTLHVDGAPPIEHVAADLPGEGIDLPAGDIAWRDNVGMPGKTQVRAPLAQPGVQVLDRRRAILLESEPVTDKAELAESMLDHAERAVVNGRVLGHRISAWARATGSAKAVMRAAAR